MCQNWIINIVFVAYIQYFFTLASSLLACLCRNKTGLVYCFLLTTMCARTADHESQENSKEIYVLLCYFSIQKTVVAACASAIFPESVFTFPHSSHTAGNS